MELTTDKKEHLGIDSLLSLFAHAKKIKHRFTPPETQQYIRRTLEEVPYAIGILPPNFAENIHADAPHGTSMLVLNEVLLNTLHASLNPTQISDLMILVQTYMRDRKKIEREYANTILTFALNENELTSFPESYSTTLKNLSKTIIEKIIHEKQSRKMPHYKPHSLPEITEPIIHYKSSSPDIEKIKNTHFAAFKKYVNAIANIAYEITRDDVKIMAIRNEKNLAFETFKNAIATKVPDEEHFQQYTEQFRTVQRDKIRLFEELHKVVAQFSEKTPNMRFIWRFLQDKLKDALNEKLRRAEQDAHVYASMDVMKTQHESVFAEWLAEEKALEKLLSITSTLQDHFYQKMFRHLFGKKYIKLIHNALMKIILGKSAVKIDFLTGNKQHVYLGGYPQKSLNAIYAETITHFKKISTGLVGIFSEELRAEMNRAIPAIESASERLPKPVRRAPEVKKVILEEAPKPAPSLFDDIEPIPEPQEKIETQPLLPIEKEEEPVIEEQKVEPPREVQQPPEPVEKVETAPLLPIEEEFDETEFKLETPKPTPSETIETTPEEEPEFKLEPAKPAPSEKVEPPPLLPVEEETEPEFKLESTQASFSPEAQTAIQSGLDIMKNYQLGNFEKPISDAWTHIVTTAFSASGDNEVRLYVICDLAQQVSAVHEDRLSSEQKEALHRIKDQLITALKSPLEESNWDYFEGMQRDIIDGTLASLQ